ncbi:kinase-like domain-containing protein [Corynascus novoguineensis]|uniref:Kinase-like domain-containing protein n=1 Tax=Corynascus novoguineensis TaxID=1126955 RepID=A0AAN7CUH3_9PEZI|nr:kinase-like domain-containing protein [Corynascus novoguineensis]
MADPLSTIANVLTVLRLVNIAIKYIKDVKNGASECLRLRDELHIIDHLEKKPKYGYPDFPYAYVYCSYAHRQTQTPAALLSSILQQVLQQVTTSTLPAEVLSLYQLHKKHGTRPTLVQITDVLRAVTAECIRFRIIVDALDECAESDDGALEFISALRSLDTSVALLCTSRFSSVFEEYFKGADRIEISAPRKDIEIYLDSEIQQHPRLARLVHADPALKQEIINTITREFHGMFLLAKLHLESLSTKINRKAIRVALKSLPATLDATYAEGIQRMYNQAPDLVEVAKSVMFWVICAKRPLTLSELRHLYATLELTNCTPLEDDGLPDGELLTSTCGGLIMVDREAHTVRVVHYTAEEYFERTHVEALEAARLSLANACLAYLTLPNFSDGPDQVTALIRAAACGLVDNVRVLLEQGAKLESRGFLKQTALQKAASTGAEDVVKVLIEAGADVNARSPDWTTLMSAVIGNGKLKVEDTSLFLIEQGAVLPQNHAGRRAFLAASLNSMFFILGMLEAQAAVEEPLQGPTKVQKDIEPSDPILPYFKPYYRRTPQTADFVNALDELTYEVGFSKLWWPGQSISHGGVPEMKDAHNIVTKVVAAVKIFSFKSDSSTERNWMMSAMRNELALLRKLQKDPDPALLRMIQVYACADSLEVLVVMEHVGIENLSKLLASRGKLTEQQTRIIFTQLLSAVEFLHARDWVHRDIRPESILISDQESLSIKLAGFGLTEAIPTDSDGEHHGAVETLSSPGTSWSCGLRVSKTAGDIWTCGVLLHVCLCGSSPFSDALSSKDFPYDHGEQTRRGMVHCRSRYMHLSSDPARDLLVNMLAVDIVNRFSARECLAHPWMTGSASEISEVVGEARPASLNLFGE